MHICLTIAGSDSGGGAGIQADLKTFAALECYGTSVITAVTAQNTTGVQGIELISDEMVRRQMRSVLSDVCVGAIKIGMVPRAEVVTEELPEGIPLIFDPVMVATSGDRLVYDLSGFDALIERAELVTPNQREAEVLLGRSIDDLEPAAKAFGTNVLIKGGRTGRDCLCYEGEIYWFSSPSIETKNDHGTGCTLSAAIAAFRAKGHGLVEAVCAAKQYLTKALEHGLSIGKGRGPVDHFWEQREEVAGRVDHLAAVRDALEEKSPIRLDY